MQVVISQMAVLFVLLAVGFVIGKAKMLTLDGSRVLSKIVLNIATPCIILSSVLSGETGITAGETAYFLLMALLAYLIYLLISITASRVLGGDKKKHGLYSYMSSFGNVAFMGFPVIIAIYGDIYGMSSAYYVALFNIPFMVLSFSLGIVLVSGKGGKFDFKLLINPSLIAALLAIPIAITGFKAPSIITEAVRITGGMTTPGAMLVIGSTLSRVSLKGIFSEWRLFPIALLKLAVMPIIVWLLLGQIVTDELMLGVLVILSGMPTAAMAAMYAIEYGGDERVASSGIFLTTLLSCVSIPLIVYFLLM